MSEHTYEIARQCANKFTPPTASEVAQDIAARVYLSSDAIVQQIAGDVACRLLQSGLDTAIVNAVNTDLERSNAALEKEVERLKGELAWIEEVRSKQPDHPDDERMWIPEMLRAKHEVERLQGLVERAVFPMQRYVSYLNEIDANATQEIKWLKDAKEVEK